MGKAIFQPKWWTEQHGSQWANLKEALHRDWDQTKQDLTLGGHELHQTVTDTLKQAAGAEPIPPRVVLPWEEAEQPLMYGVGARHEFGKDHPTWNEGLELRLKSDWDNQDGGAIKRKWDEVKYVVKHGYDRGARP